ncbi:MAG: DUF1963 domain-containing protein [Treponema sp.]|nr:DUF1963 domain-containing protein [Treponema sp.]
MVKKFQITSFEKAENKITEPITKFGGQPVWLEEPQWPVSGSYEDDDGNAYPMTFAGQIALEDGALGNKGKKIAYIFISQGEDSIDSSIHDFDGGENEIIIQPGGTPGCDILVSAEGPTCSDCEYIPKLQEDCDPEFISDADFDEMSSGKKMDYLSIVGGNKIGGVPRFHMGDQWPDDDPGEYTLLLQLDSCTLPFELDTYGEAGLIFAFVDKGFEYGGLIIQTD